MRACVATTLSSVVVLTFLKSSALSRGFRITSIISRVVVTVCNGCTPVRVVFTSWSVGFSANLNGRVYGPRPPTQGVDVPAIVYRVI